MTIRETVTASKQRLGPEDALRLARGAGRVIVSKGKKVTVFDMKTKPDEETLLAAMLGPTGNLRAPTMKVGRTLLVGFSDEAYGTVFG